MKLIEENTMSFEQNYKFKNEIFHLINQALDINDFNQANILLSKLHHADIADLIDNSSFDTRKKLFDILGINFNPEILVELDSNVRESILDIIGSEIFAQALNKLDIDKSVAILEDLNSDKQNKILLFIDPVTKVILTESLAYPKNSAGRIMNRKIVAIEEDLTIEETLNYLKKDPNIPSDFHQLFVIDDEGKIIGVTLLSQIIRTDSNIIIKNIINKAIFTINTNIDQEEVSYLFKQYSLTSAPVVNDKNILVGIITIENILDVSAEETEEDILKMVGVGETDFHSSSFEVVKHRFPWLFINLITSCITASVIGIFQNTIQHLVALAAIMPIVASMGGNAGSQTLTVAVRAIANRNLNINNAVKIIYKEIFSNAANGVMMSIFGGIIIYIWQSNLLLSLVFGASVVINFTLAGFFGATIPVLLTKMGADPAVSSSVFLTSLTDLIGFFTFLGLASLFLI